MYLEGRVPLGQGKMRSTRGWSPKHGYLTRSLNGTEYSRALTGEATAKTVRGRAKMARKMSVSVRLGIVLEATIVSKLIHSGSPLDTIRGWSIEPR